MQDEVGEQADLFTADLPGDILFLPAFIKHGDKKISQQPYFNLFAHIFTPLSHSAVLSLFAHRLSTDLYIDCGFSASLYCIFRRKERFKSQIRHSFTPIPLYSSTIIMNNCYNSIKFSNFMHILFGEYTLFPVVTVSIFFSKSLHYVYLGV